MKGNEGQTHAAFEHAVSQRIADMQSEDTERYVIQPIEPFYGGGLVWLKRGSGEMLIVVNGLHSLEEKDYQVWLQDEDRLSSAGFMLVQARRERAIITVTEQRKRSGLSSAWSPKGKPETDRARSRSGEYGALMPRYTGEMHDLIQGNTLSKTGSKWKAVNMGCGVQMLCWNPCITKQLDERKTGRFP